MFIVIVGGGKVGSYLTRALLQQHHEVVVVEKEERKAKMLERLIEQEVTVVGDGCDPYVLEQAGVGRADVVVADTGDDEDNLVVCLIAKKRTKARCIARVNNPRNKQIFESLDPEDPVTVISSTEILLDVLNERVNAQNYGGGLEYAHLFGKGDLDLIKVALPTESPYAGKRLSEVRFPPNSAVVALDRTSEDLLIPNGETALRAGDQLLVVVKTGDGEAVREALTGAPQ